MKKVILSILACSAISSAAFAGPRGPGGELVVPEVSRTVTIPANQALKLTIYYKALKEVRAQVWYSDNDTQYTTNSNTYVGPGPHIFTTEMQGYPREINISGWSKDCRAGERKCARLGWVQEPYHIFAESRTIGFEDSYDGDYIPGTYDDVQVTVTCLNDKAACPI